jgi:hypothetical protein
MMTPASAKAKGRALQQKVRDLILELFPDLTSDDVRSTSMGAAGEDVTLSQLARRRVPFQIECKSKARSQVHTYYAQAKSHGDHEPLVIVKQDRKETLAILDAEVFFKLLKELSEVRDSN